MPVPATINDISTTAGSNSPSGSETPTDGDNHIRTAYSFIAELRDKLNGTTVPTLDDPAFSGTASGSLAGLSLSSPTFSGTASGSLAGLTLATPAFTGNPTGTVTSGTYTPTYTNVNNVASTVASVAQWMRVGNVVTVSFYLTLTVTSAATGTNLGVSLPVASNLAATGDLAGSAWQSQGSNEGLGALIYADAANNRANIYWVSVANNAPAMSGSFTYVVL